MQDAGIEAGEEKTGSRVHSVPFHLALEVVCLSFCRRTVVFHRYAEIDQRLSRKLHVGVSFRVAVVEQYFGDVFGRMRDEARGEGTVAVAREPDDVEVDAAERVAVVGTALQVASVAVFPSLLFLLSAGLVALRRRRA